MDAKERLALLKKRNSKIKKPEPGMPWPMEKRLEVVSQWLILGNMRLVAAVTGVEYDTVRQWKTRPWWAEMVREIRSTQNIELDTKMSTLVEKSIEASLDRVINGDFVYDQKTGQVTRKPAALRDIHRVAVDMISKREFLRDKSDDKKEDTRITVEDQLKVLANEMAKWFEPKKHKDNLDIIEDVTPKEEDAVSEEWEEGLQARIAMGETPSTEPGEGSGGAEQGTSDRGESREGEEG